MPTTTGHTGRQMRQPEFVFANLVLVCVQVERRKGELTGELGLIVTESNVLKLSYCLVTYTWKSLSFQYKAFCVPLFTPNSHIVLLPIFKQQDSRYSNKRRRA